MKNIGIVTDSGASLPESIAAAYDLDIVPMGIQVEGRIVRDGIDMTREAFYALMSEVLGMSTSQPSPGDFLEVYERAAEKARELISIHITSKASGTYQVANLIKDKVAVRITMFDTLSCSMGQGFLVIEAAKAAQAGKSRDEIIALLESLRDNVAVYAVVPTLKYLSRSGKVGRVKALVANLLNVKPIISMRGGAAEVVGKVRSQPKALDQLIRLVEERFLNQRIQAAVMHTNAHQKAEEFKQLVQTRLQCEEILVTDMGSALAVHGGPGMIGIAAYPVDWQKSTRQ